MKNKPNPFIPSSLVIKEQLQNINDQLKALEKGAVKNVLEAYNQIKYAIRAIDKQHAKTMSVVMAALSAYEPGVVHAFADNQLAPQMMGQKMLQITEALFLYTAPTEKATATAALIHQSNKYSFTLHEHINKEEVTLLPLLQRYYNEEEMLLMQIQIEQVLAAKNLQTLVPEPSV
jgi:predicted component of type VI protein secretion system